MFRNLCLSLVSGAPPHFFFRTTPLVEREAPARRVASRAGGHSRQVLARRCRRGRRGRSDGEAGAFPPTSPCRRSQPPRSTAAAARLGAAARSTVIRSRRVNSSIRRDQLASERASERQLTAFCDCQVSSRRVCDRRNCRSVRAGRPLYRLVRNSSGCRNLLRLRGTCISGGDCCEETATRRHDTIRYDTIRYTCCSGTVVQSRVG